MELMHVEEGHVTELATSEGTPEQVHVFDQKSIDAVNAALGAGRPLLVRGEPGTGKSQLARAAAKELGRVFVSYVVDSRTESRDLLWQFDAVSRLAEAQLCGALQEDADKARSRLEVAHFVTPGPLWWGFDWAEALAQAGRAGQTDPQKASLNDGGHPDKGGVVLIDEIDKAESDVPNGLLEALGAGRFVPMGRTDPVCAYEPVPLVVITTNEERRLPDAFVRRCLVLRLALPKSRTGLIDQLVERGRAHFGQNGDEEIDFLKTAAGLLADDREVARRQRLPLPGQAEYLDLVRAVLKLARGNETRRDEILKTVSEFTLKKHVGET